LELSTTKFFALSAESDRPGIAECNAELARLQQRPVPA
jgi:hypothetical protein